MVWRGIQEYIARDANNIARVEDEGNIDSISDNILLYPSQGHPILYIIIHTELLVAKIKSCIPKLCDKEGNIFLILPWQYFFNIAQTLCDQSFPRIVLCPAHLSYCCYVPQAFAFVR